MRTGRGVHCAVRMRSAREHGAGPRVPDVGAVRSLTLRPRRAVGRCFAFAVALVLSSADGWGTGMHMTMQGRRVGSVALLELEERAFPVSSGELCGVRTAQVPAPSGSSSSYENYIITHASRPGRRRSRQLDTVAR